MTTTPAPEMKEPYFITRSPEFTFIDSAVAVDGEWRGRYSGDNLAAMQERYPDAELMEYDEAKPLHDAAMIAKYCKPLKEVTAERYDDMLNVLPPLGWVRNHSDESFKLCEMTTGNLTLIVVRLGKKYYEYTGDVRTKHADIIQHVQAEIAAGAVVPLASE
jgi:roadblock/LC7 domain-containing protein